MRRHNVLSIAITVLFFFAFLPVSMRAQNSALPNHQELYKEIMLHLDEIEQHNPKAQVSIYKTRDALNKLYSHISGDLTDPFHADGNLAVPDMEKGADMYGRATGLRDEALKKELLSLIDNHVSVGYQRAQDLVFSDIDKSRRLR